MTPHDPRRLAPLQCRAMQPDELAEAMGFDREVTLPLTPSGGVSIPHRYRARPSLFDDMYTFRGRWARDAHLHPPAWRSTSTSRETIRALVALCRISRFAWLVGGLALGIFIGVLAQ